MTRSLSRPTARPVVALAAGLSLLALGGAQSTAASDRADAGTSQARVATVATVTTGDFRVAVVARRLGGSPPTADVRVGIARRVGGSWRERGERRLSETSFWRTVTGPRAVCRLEIATAGRSPSFRPFVTVQLLQSPSLGCGKAFRVTLPTR